MGIPQGVPGFQLCFLVGKFVDRFEAQLADLTGAKLAVAVVNGTAALHIGLQLAGVGRATKYSFRR